MDKVHIFAFTDAGEKTAKRIQEQLGGNLLRVKNLKEAVAPAFARGKLLVFVGAVGIAVRAIAPYIRHKTKDPAVLVADETARFIIPILSGHLGGANGMARDLAELLGATPVITTATDLNGVFAVDEFAKAKGLTIKNPEAIKSVSASLLAKRSVGLTSDYPLAGSLPDGNLAWLPPSALKLMGAEIPQVGIYVGLDVDYRPYEVTLHLIPPVLALGLGARQGTDPAAFRAFIEKTLAEAGLPKEAIFRLDSLDLKAEEDAILELAAAWQVPFYTHSRADLAKVDHLFSQSDFVAAVTGLGNVCESSAFIGADMGEIIMEKTKGPAMTMAVARRAWQLAFD